MLGKSIGRTLLILGLLSFALPVFADQGIYQISIDSGSHLWIDGNSTLHKYKIETSTIKLDTGSLTLSSPTIPDVNTFLAQISGNFVLTIPVKSLTDPEPGFNKALWKNMDYKKYPDIVFSLTNASATPDPSVAGRYNVAAQGDLRIKGTVKQEDITAVFDVTGNTIKITGSKDLLMSDFGIKPPTMFFGTIKTDDAVTIPWDISLSVK